MTQASDWDSSAPSGPTGRGEDIERAFTEDPPVTRTDLRRPAREASRAEKDADAETVSRGTSSKEGNGGNANRPRPVSRETPPSRPAGAGLGEAADGPAAEAEAPSRSARVIAIVNQKGGVGKTTTAVNLSACLAVAEKRTLLIDLDPQGNASSGLGIAKETLRTSVYDVIVNETPLSEAVLPTAIAHLDLVPATVALFGAEVELVSAIGREHRLRVALDGSRSRYDFVFVDCPPSLGLLTVNALTAVDSVLIPIQCEYYALEGLSQLLGTIRIVQKRLNRGLTIEGVLLTMYDARLNLARQVEEEAVEYFGEKVYDTVIPRNVRLSEAPSFGKPVILYDILSAGAVGYMDLAEELITRCRTGSGSEKA